MPRERNHKINLETLTGLMWEKGWVSADLADKAAISSRTVDSIMAGNGVLMSTLKKIAKAFGVPIPYLIQRSAPTEDPEISQRISRFPVLLRVEFADETKATKFIEGLAQLLDFRHPITIEQIMQEKPEEK